MTLHPQLDRFVLGWRRPDLGWRSLCPLDGTISYFLLSHCWADASAGTAASDTWTTLFALRVGRVLLVSHVPILIWLHAETSILTTTRRIVYDIIIYIQRQRWRVVESPATGCQEVSEQLLFALLCGNRCWNCKLTRNSSADVSGSESLARSRHYDY